MIKFSKTMLATIVFAPLISAFSQTTASSIVTVDQLLLLENKKAIALSNKEATRALIEERKASAEEKKERASLDATTSTDFSSNATRSKKTGNISKTPEIPIVQVEVEAIYGVSNRLMADMKLDGKTYRSSSVGSVLGDCKIELIESRLVKLISTSTAKCPALVQWTGIRVASPAPSGNLNGHVGSPLSPNAAQLPAFNRSVPTR